MEHPITPPPELRRLWTEQARLMHPHDAVAWIEHVANQAARWGDEQRLKAVCKWLAQETPLPYIAALRAAMRLKPPSLAEEALDRCNDYIDPDGIIRRALERLQQLEQESND